MDTAGDRDLEDGMAEDEDKDRALRAKASCGVFILSMDEEEVVTVGRAPSDRRMVIATSDTCNRVVGLKESGRVLR